MLWLAGLLVALAPVLGLWLSDPSTWTTYVTGANLQSDFAVTTHLADFWTRLPQSMLGIVLLPDASPLVGYPGHFLTSLLAPLLVLSLGALVRDVNRFIGWCLVSWIAGVILISSLINDQAPWWPTLLPLIPVIGLSIAYGFENIRRIWSKGVQWSPNAAIAAVTAGIIAAGCFGWLEYQEFARLDHDVASATGRAIGQAPADRPAILVASTSERAAGLLDPVVTFLAAGQNSIAPRSILAAELPGESVTCGWLVIQPDDRAALTVITQLYPAYDLVTERDLHANPTVYVVDLGGCTTG